MATQERVNNYLVPAILTTICCCWPLGIPAIVFAARVNGNLADGDYAAAVENSSKAKRFSIYAAIAAAVVWVLFGILWGALVAFGILNSSVSSY